MYIDLGWRGQFLVWRNELLFAKGVAGPPCLNMPGESTVYKSCYNTCHSNVVHPSFSMMHYASYQNTRFIHLMSRWSFATWFVINFWKTHFAKLFTLFKTLFCKQWISGILPSSPSPKSESEESSPSVQVRVRVTKNVTRVGVTNHTRLLLLGLGADSLDRAAEGWHWEVSFLNKIKKNIFN